MLAATGLLVIAASGPGFGLDHTVHTVYMNFGGITKENEITISPDWGNCFGPWGFILGLQKEGMKRQNF